MDSKQSLEEASPVYVTKDDQLVTHAQRRFYASTLCSEARDLLQTLVDSPDYNTDPSSPISDPTPFVERHLNHLCMYPKTNLYGYISNLKIMTSIKHSR